MSNELDKHINAKLGKYESAVDAEALWQAVRPPRRRRPVWLILLLAGLVVAGAGTGWWLREQTNPVAADGTLEQAVSFEQGTDNTFTPTTQILEHKTSPSAAVNSVAPILDVPVSRQADKAPVTREDKRIRTSFSTSNTASVNPTKQDLPSQASTFGKEAKGLPTTPGVAEAAHPQGGVSTGIPPVIAPPSSKLLRTTTVTLLPNLEFLAVGQGENPQLPHLVMAEMPSAPKQRVSPWFVQADAYYYKLSRDLTAPNDSLNLSRWAAARRETETLLEATAAEITLGYHHEKGWQVRAGLGFTQLNTAFAYTATTTEVDSTEGLQMVVIYPDNSVDSIYGPVARYQTTTYRKRTYNSIRQWELPVMVGYSFTPGKLNILLEAGVRLQVQRKLEGDLLAPDEGILDWSATNWYRTGFGYSLQGGVLLGYSVSPRVNLSLGASVRYAPQDYTRSTAPFAERYQMLGVQLGIQYRLR
jgi:hypothetical protein